ncbi:small MutS related family protein [Heterostelium album PN500]|uniref:Small MutS related family protein n=1 Tax=Heterostelium pallidum (strain ATCC 26659 / Pp 5 / PN500) TaxID=670386 RepID=D3BE75_HETP5|nr:small MutS related family protein [Heterostelium album PN500]EFA80206.1 small MutS related family protein [Heterostelium album PN500]|eukprot:XP_020432326.1 small MutS related family protein [Heterostelium album PN500]
MGNICGKSGSSEPKVKKTDRTAAPPAANTAKQAPQQSAAARPAEPAAAAPASAATSPSTAVSPKSVAPTQPTTTTTTNNTSGSSGQSSSSPASSGPTTKTVEIDKELHKYVIGTKGANIKEIKEQTGVTAIDIPESGNTISVTGPSGAAVDNAIARIERVKSEHKTQSQKDKEYKDMRDGHEAESQRTDALYKKYQVEVDKHAQKRSELFEEADREYNAGNKDRARELREQAKNETTLMEEAQKKGAREVFNDKNKNLDDYTIDLHGLQTAPALEFVEERMEKLKSNPANKGKQFTIITGAGNHSDANGPKIKPLIHKTLKERGIAYEEVNNGSISCTL